MAIIAKPQQAAPIADADRRATQVRRIATQSAAQMLNGVKRGLNAIWSAPDPAGVLASLGTDAGPAFQLNSDAVEFLLDNLVGSDFDDELQEVLDIVEGLPATTTDEEGNVTID